jgi:peptidoglycan/xylan/chitin deacetylase (PgdA/CDA1 family)
VSVPGKYVAITFDDGPNSSLTPQVLDILKRHGAHATFFVLGDNASRNPGILSRAVAEGHEIGNHTYSHIKMTASSNEKIASEISRTNSIITSATGRRPKVMRPPYGATNASVVNKMFSGYGMRSIMWSIDTEDWRHPWVGVVVRRAVGSAKPGSIILLHDIHSSTIAAVEDIVTGLQARGYTLVTVSQLIEMGKQAAQAKTAQTGLQQEKVSAAPVPVSGGAGAAVISGSASL